jgi:hypothetical protein
MSGSLISTDLPWIEDIMALYYKKTLENTFPAKDFTTVFIAVFHIIGVIALYFGVLLPPKYLWAHTIFLGLILGSYFVFENNCFMTLFANMNTTQSMTPLYFRIKTAFIVMTTIFIISLLSNFFPKYAPFNIIKSIILIIDK